jgi:aryl-alcohol dehydrogenase-like predicted oxidoreductase
VVLGTKVGLEWHEGGEVSRNSSPARIERELEDSLRRLQTDYIDLYQLHWPDEHTSMQETALAMAGLFKAGTIRAVGVSNFSAAQMDAFARYAPLHSVQPPYNIFERAADREVLPYAQSHGLCALTYGAICRGLLSGTMNKDTVFVGDDLRRTDPKFRQPRFDQYLRAVARLDTLARERFGKRVIHLALRWVLDSPGVGVALWGARRPDQLGALEGAFGFSITKGVRDEIDRIVTEAVTDPVGPDFMAPPLEARP